MAPRSARKRKANEGDASAPNRRKKREGTPMKASGRAADAMGGQPSLASASPPLTLSTPEQQQAEIAAARGDGITLSFDPDESQLMDALDDSPCGEQPEDLFPLMLETQYEEDEDAEEKEAGTSIDEALEACSATEHDPVDTNADEATADETSAFADRELLDDEEEVDDEERNRDSLVGASASIEEILQQLAEVASNFMTNYRELTNEGDVIQAELDELNEAQQARCAKMLGRLERAGNSIFSFGQAPDTDDVGDGDKTQVAMAHSQV